MNYQMYKSPEVFAQYAYFEGGILALADNGLQEQDLFPRELNPDLYDRVKHLLSLYDELLDIGNVIDNDLYERYGEDGNPPA